MATLTLQQRLDEAEDALHRLMTGAQVVQFRDANGEQLSYTAANAARLRGYIADLKRQLGQPGDGPMYLVTG